MRGRLLRHPALPLVTGAVLVVAGLLLTRVPPRADAPNVPPPAVAGAPTPAATPRATPVAEPAAPTAVSLPGTPHPIPVVPVGVRPSRALELPDRPSVLGWYAAGAVPGDSRGTAVVAGHVDSAEFGAGPLRGLLNVNAGDPVEVIDAVGGTHRYAVTSRTTYRKADLPAELFRSDGPPRLALVTCGGAFDERTGQYAANVVVLAAPAPTGGPSSGGR